MAENESKESKDARFKINEKNFNFFNNGGERFPLETLNSNSSYSQISNSNASGDFFEHGFDPELSFGFTFKNIGAGLENLGNTCYLNSVLQCLTYTEPFVAYLLSGRHTKSCKIAGFCAMCAIQNHVSHALESTGRILSPKYLVKNMELISRDFSSARQEDAHEYMVHLLESMHKCCLPSGLPSESPSAYEKSLVHKIFGGLLRSQVKCTECSYGSNKYDPFLDLSLEIEKAHSLLEALVNFTAVEQLDGGEKQYQCQLCKQKVRAVRQLTIHKAPYVLTIHLKRFGSIIFGRKIDKKLEFGPTLDLRDFVSGSYEGGLKYTLYGVLVHAGYNTHSGHYYCFVRTSGGMWYVLDDNEVFPVEERIVLEQRAYMLFYVRDRRNRTPKKPIDVVQKENLVMNHVENKETIQIGLSTRGSSIPVCLPISKVEVVASGSVEGSSLKSPSGSGDLLVEGPDREMNSDEASLQVLKILSVQQSSDNHTVAESLLQTVSFVVEDGDPYDASIGAKAEATNEQEEAQVARQPDNNILQESTSKTSLTEMDHETLSVNGIPLSKAQSGSLPAKAFSGAESDGRTSHPYGTCNGAHTKAVNRLEEVKATNNDITTESLPQLVSTVNYAGIVSHPTSAKSKSTKEPEEVAEKLTIPVPTLPESTVLLEFASTPSAAVIENEIAFVDETTSSNTPGKSLSQSISSAVVGGCTISHPCFGFTGAKDKAIDEHGKAKAADDCIMAEGSLSIASSVVKDDENNISHHTCDKTIAMIGREVTMEDLTVPVPTHLECTAPPEATNLEYKNVVLDETVPNRAEVGALGPTVVDSMQLSSQPGAEATQCKKVNDVGPALVSFACLSSESGTEEASFMRGNDLHPEKADSILLSSQSGNEGTLGGTSHSRLTEVGSSQLPNQLDNKETLCERIDDLGSEDVGSRPSSSGHGAEDGQDSNILEGRDSIDGHNAEVNGLKPGVAKSVDISTPSSTSNRCDQKEAVAYVHCQKVVKPNKHPMARKIFSSSPLFRASIGTRRKKKLKKNRKRRVKYMESAQKDFREEFTSGMEASTSEKTQVVSTNASFCGRRQGNSGANYRHDRTAARDVMDNYGESTTMMEVDFRGRSSHNAAVLATDKPPLERSSSTLTTNSCGSQSFDSSQDRSSVSYYMSILMRGLGETNAGSWSEIGSNPSEVISLSNVQSMDVDHISDKRDVDYDSGRRKRANSRKNGLGGANSVQESAVVRDHSKKARMDLCSSGNRPFRI